MGRTGTVNRYGTGLLPFAVYAQIDTYEGPGWVTRQLRGRSGWLKVSRARMETPFSSWTTTLVAAITDDGMRLNKMVSDAFFRMSCAGPLETDDLPPEELDDITGILFDGFRGGCDVRHLRMLREDEQDRALRAKAEEARGEGVLADADAFIANMRRERREPSTTSERRVELDAMIEMFETKQQAAAAWLIQRLRKLRDGDARFESDVMEALENPGEIEELYAVRWVGRHRSDRMVEGRDMAELVALSHRLGVPGRAYLSTADLFDLEEVRRLRRAAPDAPVEPKHVRVGKLIAEWKNREAELERRVHRLDAIRREVAAVRVPTREEVLAGLVEREQKLDLYVQSDAYRAMYGPGTGPSQKPAADLRAQEAARKSRQEIDDLLALYPTIHMLARRLDEVLDSDHYDFRFAKLIRRAIRRLNRDAATHDSPTQSLTEEPNHA